MFDENPFTPETSDNTTESPEIRTVLEDEVESFYKEVIQ